MSLEAETNASGYNLLAGLRPDRNPFYIITIACVFTLTFSASQLKSKPYLQTNWNFLFYLIAFILLLNIVLSLIPQEIDNTEYEKNLRFARTLGITTATISLIFLKEALSNTPTTFIFILIIIQISIFSIYLFIGILKRMPTNNTLNRRINNFQLCLITSTLLMGIVVNYNYSIDELNNHKEAKKSVEANITQIKNYQPDTLENGDVSFNIDTAQLNADNIIANKNASDAYVFHERHALIVYLLLILWIICILTWIYQLKVVLNVKINLDNPPD